MGRSQGRNVLASEGARGQPVRLIHKEGALAEEKKDNKVRSLGPRAPGQKESAEWLFDFFFFFMAMDVQRLAGRVSLKPDREGRPETFASPVSG